VHGGNSRFEFAREAVRDRYFHNSARLLRAGYSLFPASGLRPAPE
jgi:hypothetical protein